MWKTIRERDLFLNRYGLSSKKIEILKRKGYKFLYDLDNTSCLWCNKGEDKKTLERVFEKGFFANLKPIDDIELAVKTLTLLGLDVFVISACVNSPYCKAEKMEWINRYLPWIKDDHIILCEMGENKASYIKDNIETAVLIDDYGKNLMEWQEAGGIAVKKSTSNKRRSIPVVRNHMEIFDVITQLVA